MQDQLARPRTVAPLCNGIAVPEGTLPTHRVHARQRPASSVRCPG